MLRGSADLVFPASGGPRHANQGRCWSSSSTYAHTRRDKHTHTHTHTHRSDRAGARFRGPPLRIGSNPRPWPSARSGTTAAAAPCAPGASRCACGSAASMTAAAIDDGVVAAARSPSSSSTCSGAGGSVSMACITAPPRRAGDALFWPGPTCATGTCRGALDDGDPRIHIIYAGTPS